MDDTDQELKRNQLYKLMLVAGIVTVAFNLRPAITAVGPLLGAIRDDIGLSHWSVALLTSLPLIAFAVMSPIIPRFGYRYTNEKTLLFGLVLLLVGISVRSISNIPLLFLGTFIIGVGIAVCNVLLPGIIKEKFPLKIGLMTSVYSTIMGIFAATASGVSIPLAEGLGLGWQKALLAWALPALLGIACWIYITKNSKQESDVQVQYIKTENNRMWKSSLAWQVALFMGFQSFLFYVSITWFPEILHDYGVDLATAGWLLFFTQMIGLPAGFIVPVLADRMKSQRSLVVILGICAIGGFLGLLLGESIFVMMISIVIYGQALGGIFPLALTLLSLRAQSARQAAELSGMAQSFGYVLAAVGPMLIGYLYDLTGTWKVPLVVLIIVAMLVVLFGLGAARNRYVMTEHHI